MRWDPEQYGRYSAERSRPFFDLVGQIGCPSPSVVVDLGCGPGNVTVALTELWPDAEIRGIDSSPDMIAAATPLATGTSAAATPGTGSLTFEVGDATDFSAAGVDVLLSNAMLQWVPDHLPLLTRWASELNDGGWLAFQVPANFGNPSHTLLRELAATERWRDRLDGVSRGPDAVATPEEYLDVLSSAGLTVDAWQTTYLHVLHGDDPVLEWVRGTALRPVLNVLTDDAERAAFETGYAELLRNAYPARPYGTVFPFPRTFVVGHKP